MTANAKGCESVSGSTRTDCGTPTSVRTKSSAASGNTTLPALVFTSTGTSTRFERAVMVGTCEIGDDCPVFCSLAAFNENQRKKAIVKANRTGMSIKSLYESEVQICDVNQMTNSPE